MLKIFSTFQQTMASKVKETKWQSIFPSSTSSLIVSFVNFYIILDLLGTLMIHIWHGRRRSSSCSGKATKPIPAGTILHSHGPHGRGTDCDNWTEAPIIFVGLE